jgi:hypothetical protein
MAFDNGKNFFQGHAFFLELSEIEANTILKKRMFDNALCKLNVLTIFLLFPERMSNKGVKLADPYSMWIP